MTERTMKLKTIADVAGIDITVEQWDQIDQIIAGRSSSETEVEIIKLDKPAIISNLLKELGIPAHIKGYRYTRYAILLALEDPSVIEAVTYELYPRIAEQFNTTSSRVERAIRHAIETAWERGDIERQNEIFSFTVSGSRGKPTNSEFIAEIADYINLNYLH